MHALFGMGWTQHLGIQGSCYKGVCAVSNGFKCLKHVNAVFACDLLTAERDELLLDAIMTLAMSDISCTCDGASAMVYVRFITCDGN